MTQAQQRCWEVISGSKLFRFYQSRSNCLRTSPTPQVFSWFPPLLYIALKKKNQVFHPKSVPSQLEIGQEGGIDRHVFRFEPMPPFFGAQMCLIRTPSCNHLYHFSSFSAILNIDLTDGKTFSGRGILNRPEVGKNFQGSRVDEAGNACLSILEGRCRSVTARLKRDWCKPQRRTVAVCENRLH